MGFGGCHFFFGFSSCLYGKYLRKKHVHLTLTCRVHVHTLTNSLEFERLLQNQVANSNPHVSVPNGWMTEVVLPIIDRLGQRRKPVPSIRLVLIWIFIFCVIQIQRWQWRDFSVHVLGLIVCETLQLLSSTVTE